MDQQGAPQPHDEATPIFEGYRRGYDPDQVDRFVADQQRRLDETLHRATEAERRLAAAVGQLRELHRRVATFEGEERSAKVAAQPLDTLGERIQRILQEAWEGAHAVRQSAEDEAGEIRQRTLAEAAAIVSAARQKAQTIEEEIEQRREAYLGRVEEERSKAVAQITYLREQRQSAVGELIRMKDAIESTVGKVAQRRLEPKPPVADAAPTAAPPERPQSADRDITRTVAPEPERSEAPRVRTVRDIPPRTMPVIHLDTASDEGAMPNAADLVRNHRAAVSDETTSALIRPIKSAAESLRATSTVFDFEEEEPS